ncbi:MAG: helix-turn-helix transcriptional regulator [Ruminococcaceae bacterium]|nr:helix-turn-helix transcriptional regulator [Oscillospiraceae bacterium]
MIGERLQELRKDRGLSQEDLAKILGVSHYTISSYECNRSDPDDKSKVILAKLFDVSVDYMLGLIDEPLSFNRENRIVQIPSDFSDNDFIDVIKYIDFLKYKIKNKNED